MLEFSDLMDAQLDSDAVLLAAEACRRYILKHWRVDGVRGGDLTAACKHWMLPLDPHDRSRVQVLLVKMPCLSCRSDRHNALRFWPATLAPADAFNIIKRDNRRPAL